MQTPALWYWSRGRPNHQVVRVTFLIRGTTIADRTVSLVINSGDDTLTRTIEG
jgi:hypothetical protein